MKKLVTTAVLGLASTVAVGVVATAGPAAAGDAAKRDEEAGKVVVTLDDDDDDDTNDDDDATNGGQTRSRESNDATNSRVTGVSRDQDRSRADLTRDMTRDGGDRTRDRTAGSTNDRSRNDTRR